MTVDPVYVAYGGVALSAAAIVMLFLVIFFGDLFLKSDRALRRWMDTIMWCVVGGIFVTAAVAAWAAVQLHHCHQHRGYGIIRTAFNEERENGQ